MLLSRVDSYDDIPSSLIKPTQVSNMENEIGSAFLVGGAALPNVTNILLIPKDLVGSGWLADLWCQAIADNAPFTAPIDDLQIVKCAMYNSTASSE